MTNLIADTADVAQRLDYEQDDDIENMTATKSPEDAPIEFHVQMRGHTQRDMELLVIEAAAQIIVGKSHKDSLAQLIEQRCQALVLEKANKVLDGVTTQIIDQPVTPKFGDKQPITMRELIGLTGREFLSEMVDSRGRAKGEKDFDSYYSRDNVTRIQWVVSQAMGGKFKDEIAKATGDAIREFRAELKARHERILAEEMARFREAMAKSQA